MQLEVRSITLFGNEIMDQRIEIWNALHDGEITAIEQDGENLTMFVSIPHLRRRMKPIGDSFVLKISGLKRLEYLDSNGKSSSLAEEIEIMMPEILETSSESMPITVTLTMGQMVLDFESVRFALDTGEAVTFDVIEKVCHEFWAEWDAKWKANVE